MLSRPPTEAVRVASPFPGVGVSARLAVILVDPPLALLEPIVRERTRNVATSAAATTRVLTGAVRLEAIVVTIAAVVVVVVVVVGNGIKPVGLGAPAVVCIVPATWERSAAAVRRALVGRVPSAPKAQQAMLGQRKGKVARTQHALDPAAHVVGQGPLPRGRHARQRFPRMAEKVTIGGVYGLVGKAVVAARRGVGGRHIGRRQFGLEYRAGVHRRSVLLPISVAGVPLKSISRGSSAGTSRRTVTVVRAHVDPYGKERRRIVGLFVDHTGPRKPVGQGGKVDALAYGRHFIGHARLDRCKQRTGPQNT